MARLGIRGLFLAAVVSLGLAAPAAADASRLVVVGGSLTEIVFALGKGGSVVGVDQTSTWPPEVKKLPQVGYYKRVSPEGVLSLAPSLVLAYRDAEPASALRQIAQAGAQVQTFERNPPLVALMDNITALGRILDAEAEAVRLSESIRRDLDAAAAKAATVSRKPRVLFLLNYDPSQMVVAGNGTIAAQLIELAGGINAAADLTGFKPLNAEMVNAAAPDLVLTVEDRWDGMGGAAGMKRLPGMDGTPAGRADRFAALPGPLMLGLGPRIGEAVRRLTVLLHGTEASTHGR